MLIPRLPHVCHLCRRKPIFYALLASGEILNSPQAVIYGGSHVAVANLPPSVAAVTMSFV